MSNCDFGNVLVRRISPTVYKGIKGNVKGHRREVMLINEIAATGIIGAKLHVYQQRPCVLRALCT